MRSEYLKLLIHEPPRTGMNDREKRIAEVYITMSHQGPGGTTVRSGLPKYI